MDGFVQYHRLVGGVRGLGEIVHIGQELGHPEIVLPFANLAFVVQVIPDILDDGPQPVSVFHADGEVGPFRLNTFFEIVVQVRGASCGFLYHGGRNVQPGPLVRGICLGADETVHMERGDDHQGAGGQG